MTTLYERLSKVHSNNFYFQKDLKKAVNATKFIGRGSLPSSTNKYMIAAGDLANCGEYTHKDVVFVSAEGNRPGRLEVDYDELLKAISARVTFVTDSFYDRSRAYNIGEREVAKFLIKHNYIERVNGFWGPPPKEE